MFIKNFLMIILPVLLYSQTEKMRIAILDLQPVEAVGGNPHRVYPWGNTWQQTYCNWYDNLPPLGEIDGYAATAPVGSYESGKSPFGLYDMAGNVWEWVKDWVKSNYYSVSPVNNPECTDGSSGWKVVRGGSWGNDGLDMRCSCRYNYGPDLFSLNVGFRVVGTF